MSLALLTEGAVRALVLGLLIFVILRAVRLREPRQVWAVWVFVLLASFAMLASMRLVPMHVTIELGRDVVQALPRGMEGAARRNLFDVATTLYAAIAGLLCLRLVAGLVWSARLLRAARPIPVPGGLDARVSARITTPVTFGRTILLPTDFAFWPVAKRQAVLAHEAAHLRWFDFHVQLVAQIHCALFWFSPFAWWLRAELRELAEQASDEAAIAAIGDKHAYAEILFDVARTAGKVSFVVAMAKGSSVERRLDQILRHQPRPHRNLSVPVIAMLAAAVLATTLIAPQASVAYETQRLTRVPASGENPLYPDRAQQQEVEGWAEFRILVDGTGKPLHIELMAENPAGYGFGETARRAVETWTFKNHEGKPRTGTYRLTFRLK